MEGGFGFPVRRRPRGSPARAARVRGAAGRVGAGGAARAVRDADAEHRGRADLGRALADRRCRAAPTSSRSRCATRCACCSPRRWRSSARRARASCARQLRRDGSCAASVAAMRAGSSTIRALVALSTARSSGCCRPCRSPSCSGSRSRYIAGPTLDDAMRVVRRLNAKGKLATIDVLGEEIASAGRGARDRRPVPRRARADRRARARREHLGQADGARARARSRPLPREPRGGRRRRRGARAVRPDRHGGLVDDRRDARSSTASYARQGTTTSASSLQAYLRRTLDDIAGLDNVRICKGI